MNDVAVKSQEQRIAANERQRSRMYLYAPVWATVTVADYAKYSPARNVNNEYLMVDVTTIIRGLISGTGCTPRRIVRDDGYTPSVCRPRAEKAVSLINGQ